MLYTFLRILIVGLIYFSISAPARADTEKVDVALVLAVDVSSSVNWTEFGLQMRGISTALRSDDVWRAVQSGPHQKISIAMLQWAGINDQALSVDWTMVSSRKDLVALANKTDTIARAFPFGGTGLAAALHKSASLFDRHPFQESRRVIDLSGDGRASVGFAPDEIRNRILAKNITINGLPILNEEKDLEDYYQTSVIGGAGAFTEIAQDYDDFSRALTRKLSREIRGAWVGAKADISVSFF